MTILDSARELAQAALDRQLPTAIELRHQLHRSPQVSGEEQATLATMIEALAPVTTRRTDLAGGSVLRSGADTGPAIAFRAEMDALPIEEQTGLPWASRVPGVSHACGHDVHMAAITAVVRAIHELGTPVPVVTVLQPREESYPSGARDILTGGGLRGHEIAAMLGIHVQPLLPAGTLVADGGVINAASDYFELTVHGRPAHGAYPHLGRDPVLAMAAVIQAIQQLVSRRIDPMRPAVVTVGRIVGGEAANQIAQAVRIDGMLRSYEEGDRSLLHQELLAISESVGAAHGCRVELAIQRGEPVLHNDEDLADTVGRALTEAGFHRSPASRSCGADDFAYYGELMSSLMIFAGVGPGGPDAPGLHHPCFAPPDEAVGELARILLTSYLAVADRMTLGLISLSTTTGF